MQYKTFLVTVSDSIARLKFNRPESYNSLTLDFWDEFPKALQAIDESAAARVLIIEAEGEHFCAGMNLQVFDNIVDPELELARSRLKLRDKITSFQQALTAVENLRIPVIAAMQGACIGGGVAIASVCDMRYCTENAFFSIEETNIGVACDIGTLQRLPHQISETHLREWVFTGERLSAPKAYRWGFVGEVYASSKLMLASVQKIATKIASQSPMAIHGCKVSMNFNREHLIQEGLDHISLWNGAILHDHDMPEALAARKAKRVASFFPLPPKI